MRKKIVYWMLLPCRQATLLIEKKLLVGLSPVEQVRLKLHKALCDPCKRFEKQSQQIEHWIENKETPLLTNTELQQKILEKNK